MPDKIILNKLILQPATKSDAGMIFNSWGTNAENFLHLSAKVQSSLSDAEDYLGVLLKGPKNFAFHVIDKESQEVIGIVKANIEASRAQVGYVINKPFSGQGYATEVLKEIVKLLKKDSSIQRIWATCSPENLATIKVLEKAGFEKECLLKRWMVYPAQGNEAKDNYSYVLSN